MKSIYVAILSMMFILSCSSKPQANIVTEVNVEVSEKPYTYKNLTIFVIKGANKIGQDYMTLAQAMELNNITLHETGSVNELSIDNNSNNHIFIMAGDIVKGGRQDRTLGEDLVLKPNAKNIPLKSFCVEQSRWSSRGGESAAQFSVSEKTLGDKQIKVAARAEKDQGKVWKEVAVFQDKVSKNIGKNVKSGISETSLQLTLEDKDLNTYVEEYVKALNAAFSEDENIVGFAFCINGKISTVEWFANSSLFAQLKDKLLEAAIYEAISNYVEGAEYETISADNIVAQINESSKGTVTKTVSLKYMEEHKYEGDNSIMFCTYDTDESKEHPLHVSIYLSTQANNNLDMPIILEGPVQLQIERCGDGVRPLNSNR